MTKIIPSDAEVLRLLQRRRELQAELDDINRTLRAVVNTGALPTEKQEAPGRPRDEDNVWAYGEIAAGRNRKVVYQEWLGRKGWEDAPRAADAFRKMLMRKKG